MEQIQLKLESQFQTGHRGENLLYAFVDFYQIIHIHAGKLDGFLNLSMFFGGI